MAAFPPSFSKIITMFIKIDSRPSTGILEHFSWKTSRVNNAIMNVNNEFSNHGVLTIQLGC